MADHNIRKGPMSEIKRTGESPDSLERQHTVEEGQVDSFEDKVNRDFYGSSLTDTYRLKSELVAKHLQEIGMGRYVDTRNAQIAWDADLESASNGASLW